MLRNSVTDTYAGPTTIFGGQLKTSHIPMIPFPTPISSTPPAVCLCERVSAAPPNNTAASVNITVQTLASTTNLIADTDSMITTNGALAGTSFGLVGSSNDVAFVRNHGSTLAYAPTDLNTALNVGTALANKKLLGGWATYGAAGTVPAITDWAGTDASGNVVSLTAAGGTYTNDTWTAGFNTNVTLGNNFSTFPLLTTGSLRFNAGKGLTADSCRPASTRSPAAASTRSPPPSPHSATRSPAAASLPAMAPT